VKSTTWGGLFAGVVLGALLIPAVHAADEAKPAAPAEPPKTETTVEPEKGFVTFKSGENSLTFGAWGEFRLTVDDREDFSADVDPAGSGYLVNDGYAASFSIPRLRVYMLGTVFKSWMRYKIEYELATLKTDATTNINNGRITDGYVEFAKSPYATVRAGQYKIPFGLEELTSDTRLEFIERSIASAKFAPGRDIGLMLSGQFFDKKFGYQAAMFNGAGQNNPQDDKAFLYTARVVYDPLGEYKLIEGAVDDPQKNILHFGLAYRFGEVPRGLSSVGVFQNPNDETALAFEFAWKLERFYAMAEYFQQTDQQANVTVGPDIDANGYTAQFGVFVVPKKQELAVRYSSVEPDESVADAKQTEMRLVYGYFWKSHNMKLQADLGEIKYGANFASLSTLALRGVSPLLLAPARLVPLPGQDITDKQLRVQFVLAF
jgi:phosphate-selective porin OprO and OprP